MKKNPILVKVCLLTTLSLSASGNSQKHNGGEYCAKVKDGKLYVVHHGKQITKDVRLSNGTIIKSNGIVIKRDGSSMVLKDGECMMHASEETASKKNSSQGRK
jgi:hypothetical protein